MRHSWLEFEKQSVLQHLLRSAAMRFPDFGLCLSLAETRGCQSIGTFAGGTEQPGVSTKVEVRKKREREGGENEKEDSSKVI